MCVCVHHFPNLSPVSGVSVYLCIYNGSHLNDIQHYYYFLDILWPLLRRFISKCGFNYGFVYATWGSDPIQCDMCLITIGFSLVDSKITDFTVIKRNFCQCIIISYLIIIYFLANYPNHRIFFAIYPRKINSVSKIRKRIRIHTKWNKLYKNK